MGWAFGSYAGCWVSLGAVGESHDHCRRGRPGEGGLGGGSTGRSKYIERVLAEHLGLTAAGVGVPLGAG